jgi:hypothetical protein
VVCSVALLQAVASVLFFATSYWSWRDEQVRNAWAAFILGLMVLAGSVLFGSIVFQSPSRPASAFEGFDLSGDASTLETENESVR